MHYIFSMLILKDEKLKNCSLTTQIAIIKIYEYELYSNSNNANDFII